MSTFFLLNNIHFSMEILGALVFLIAAWLAFDSFLIRRDFVAISRAIGFFFLFVGQVLDAISLEHELMRLAMMFAFVLGLFFILINFIIESPVKRPSFKAIVILPGAASLALPFSIIVAVGYATVVFMAFRQYKKELKTALKPFIMAFMFLTAGALLGIFSGPDISDTLGLARHSLELAGYAFLGFWVWSYLSLRIREELLMIFVSFALIMATLVSLTFSSILMNRIEKQTTDDLLINARVLDFAVFRLSAESEAKAELVASDFALKEAFIGNDFDKMESELVRILDEQRLGFLALLDSEGGVVMRANGLAARGENLANESAVYSALAGEVFTSIEPNDIDGFSIRSAAPIFDDANGGIAGVISAGFPLDNVFADGIKNITGLEMSVYDGSTRVATTILNDDGITRSVGIRQTDPRLSKVIVGGEELALRTTILSRPFLAGYIPLKDNEGRTVGILSSAKSQHEMLKTAEATNRLTLIIVISLMLIMSMPMYFVTKRLAREVK